MFSSNQKGIAPLITILIIVGVFIIAGGAAYCFLVFQKPGTNNQNNDFNQIADTGNSQDQGNNTNPANKVNESAKDKKILVTNCEKNEMDKEGVLEKGKTIGINGEFTDSCDEKGNLIEYSCEVECSPLGNVSCSIFTPTGIVKSHSIDCNGRCSAGACSSLCPKKGDTLTYIKLESNGDALFKNESHASDIFYSCELIYDNLKDNYDCRKNPYPNLQVSAYADTTYFSDGIELCYQSKSGAFGNIGINDPGFPEIEECAYECSIQIE